jgi:hypothetical protein
LRQARAGEDAISTWVQIAMANSSNATANRLWPALMAPSNVLDEGMAADDHTGGTVPFEAAHGPQLRLQSAMVGLDPVVGVLLVRCHGAGSGASSTIG